MRKRLDAPENRREIARQPSAKNQPRRAKCPAATNATVSGARIFRDNWEVRKNDADPATVRGDEPATATVDAVYGKARAKKILKPGNQPENSYGTDAAMRSVRSTMIGPRSCHEKMLRHGSAVLPAGGRNRLRQDGHPARRLRNFDGQRKARNRRHRKGLQESRRE